MTATPAKKAAAKKAPAKKTAAKKKAGPKLSALDKAREDFVADFEKEFGSDALDRSGDTESHYEVISTGCLSLDYALGVGGYVEGRITEIWGGDAIGKTTLILQGMREAQRKHPDKLVAFIDMEGTFDRAWAVLHGVNVAKNALYIITPNSAEEVADQMKKCLRSGLFSMVVLDSIGAMIPEAEKDKEADEAVVAIQAKIVTRMVKIAAVEARRTSTAVVLLNQVRARIAKMGKTETTSGGFALKHCSTHKIELKMGGTKISVQMQGETRTVGHPIAAMIERNKVAPPFMRASFTLFHTNSSKYGAAGIDKPDDAATIGIKTGAIRQKGAWYYLPHDTENEEGYNGRDALVAGLRANPDLVDEVREAALATISGQITDEDDDLDALRLDPETGEIIGDIDGASDEEVVGVAREIAEDPEGHLAKVKSRFGSLTSEMAGQES